MFQRSIQWIEKRQTQVTEVPLHSCELRSPVSGILLHDIQRAATKGIVHLASNLSMKDWFVCHWSQDQRRWRSEVCPDVIFVQADQRHQERNDQSLSGEDSASIQQHKAPHLRHHDRWCHSASWRWKELTNHNNQVPQANHSDNKINSQLSNTQVIFSVPEQHLLEAASRLNARTAKSCS